MGQILLHLLIWSLVGFLVFNLYVVVAFRTGLVYTTRKDDGTLKEIIPLIGVVSTLIVWTWF